MAKLNALKLLITLAVVIVMSIIKEIKKDGFQATDLFAFLGSEEFKAQIGPMVQELPHMAEQFKNFDGLAGFEIARIAVDAGEQIYVGLTTPATPVPPVTPVA